MTAKELIEQIKDYADCADASYAMLHFVEQNEEKGWLDDIHKPSLWLYADGIKQGYEIKDEHLKDKSSKTLIENNNRKIGEPTAYALAIEARFSENIKIQKPKKDNPNELDKPQEIDNKIQSFIYREKEDKESKESILAFRGTRE